MNDLLFIADGYKTKGYTISSIVWSIGKEESSPWPTAKGIEYPWCTDWGAKKPTTVWCLFVRDHVLIEKMNLTKSMLTQFIDQSSDDTLALLMQFCTGSKTLPPIQNFHITVDFHGENYIFASTCLFSLQLPYFSSYGLFEAALLSTILSLGKSFTAVWMNLYTLYGCGQLI